MFTVKYNFPACSVSPADNSHPMQLIAIYKKLKEAKKEFEIIYVCLDNDEEEWKEYFASMPWISLPYSDTRKKTLCKALEL